MDVDLLETSTNELLRKFGAGNHKPGSGSAAALQGMLAAQLVMTVINLTTDGSRRRNYEEFVPRLTGIAGDIEHRIYPELARLFREDSIQFDKVVRLRKARDQEADVDRKNDLADQALLELISATERPIEIAALCAELADFAGYSFDHGFKSARGDSGVALSAAVSGVAGCISIVDLNLLSFGSDEWTERIRSRTDFLRSTLRSLVSGTKTRLESLEREASSRRRLSLKLNQLGSEHLKGAASDGDIEAIARELQITMWKHRADIWRHGVPEDPIGVLKPEVALRHLGYKFDLHTTLGQYQDLGERFEVAGLIDKQRRRVAISQQFPVETRNFTAAHELGHALFHEQHVMHRDKALDGSGSRAARSVQEQQADRFASCFLMPRKLVSSAFLSTFSTERFQINDETAFALNAGNPEALRARCGSLRGLTRTLATTKFFDGKSVYSLSEQFRVSAGAMAIRLEELGLVEF